VSNPINVGRSERGWDIDRTAEAVFSLNGVLLPPTLDLGPSFRWRRRSASL
jgi:hypothetical protein